MSHELPKTKLKRVFKGDSTTQPISMTGFVLGKVPEDGFIVTVEGPGAMPMYIRDSDIERARVASAEKGKSVSVTALSWNEKEGDSDGSGNG